MSAHPTGPGADGPVPGGRAPAGGGAPWPGPRRRAGAAGAVVLLAGLLAALPAGAAPPGVHAGVAGPGADAAAPRGAHPPRPAGNDTVRARPFADRADSLVRAALEEHGIPGAALVVVEGGEVSLARGYGTADLAGGTPVSPRTTRFPVGSISKVATAIAVLRLAREDRLALDRPVTELPGGEVLPEGPGGPVTLHHLLTHTAGLETASVGMASREPPTPGELRRALAAHRPGRVQPPGRLYLYSQFGYGLAGLVAARTAGRPFAELVDRRVLEPLGMERSTFRPDALDDPRTATGYFLAGGDTLPVPTAHHEFPPTGGLVATPRDLGRLAAALVGGGPADTAAGGALPPALLERLTARQWSPHPRPGVEGTAYGLFEHRACGLRALTTRGWAGGYSLYLHVVPERRAGFVAMANASTLGGLQTRLRRELHASLSGGCGGAKEPSSADTAAGQDGGRGGADAGGRGAGGRRGTDAPVAPDTGSRDSARGAPPRPARLYGRYRGMGYPARGVEGLGRWLLAPQITVEAGADGPVLDFGDARVAARMVERGLLATSWREGKTEHFTFVSDAAGRVTHMMWGGIAFERVPPHRSRTATTGAALLLAAVLLAGAAGPGTRLAARRLRGETASGNGRPLATWLRRGTAALSLLGIVAAVVMAHHLVLPRRFLFAYGVPGPVRAALWALPLMAAGSAAVAAGAALAWRRGTGSRWERVLWTLVAAAGLAAGGLAATLGLGPLG